MFVRFLIVSFLFVIVGCSESDSSKTASLVQPRVEVKIYGEGGDNPKVKLPLLTWPSFKEQNISLSKQNWNQGASKALFCVVEENDGTPIEIGAKIKFIENSVCNHTYFRPSEGIPQKRELGLVKIKIVETGQEVWTWSSAVENISSI